MDNLHFISIDSETTVIFFPDTKRFIKVNKGGHHLVRAISNDIPYHDISNDLNISVEDYEVYKEKIYSLANCTRNGKNIFRNMHINEMNIKTLERLVIHVTNDCNLRCKYCYAHGGAYGGTRSMLSEDMADIILDSFYSQFERIVNVQLFGGEPLMNIKVMERICEYVRFKDLQRNQKTNIALVTNATLIDDEFISIVKKYEIHITISYDGEVNVNNLLRPYEDGSCTSNDILNNTLRLYKETNHSQPETIEVTYTQYHIENNIKIVQIIDNIKSMLENTSVHLVPVSSEEDCSYSIKDLQPFAESIDEIFNNTDKVYSYSIADRIFYGLNKEYQPSRHICVAGNSTLSVSVEGDVYPCFMFTNQDSLCLGNVKDSNLFKSEKFKSKLKKIGEFSDKTKNPECKKCFIRSLCVGCLGLNASHNQDHFEINHKICNMFRNMAEHAIKQYIKNEMSIEVNQDEKTTESKYATSI